MIAILAAFKGRKPWELFFTLLATTGLRASEILGLRVVDLDFEENLIHVRQGAWHGQIITVKTRESENSVPMTTRVKSSPARTFGRVYARAYIREPARASLFAE